MTAAVPVWICKVSKDAQHHAIQITTLRRRKDKKPWCTYCGKSGMELPVRKPWL